MWSSSCNVMSIPEREQICFPLQCNVGKEVTHVMHNVPHAERLPTLGRLQKRRKTRVELSSSPCFRVSQTLTWKPSHDICVCIPSRSRFSPVALSSSGRRHSVLCTCFVQKWNRLWVFGERRIRRRTKETCKDPFLILPSSQPPSPCVSHGRNLRME